MGQERTRNGIRECVLSVLFICRHNSLKYNKRPLETTVISFNLSSVGAEQLVTNRRVNIRLIDSIDVIPFNLERA